MTIMSEIMSLASLIFYDKYVCMLCRVSVVGVKDVRLYRIG